MRGMPVGMDLLGSIYDSVNSLNGGDVEFFVDSSSSPFKATGSGQTSAPVSNGMAKVRVVSGLVSTGDGGVQRESATKGWAIAFPAGAGFTSPPVVVANPIFAGPGAEPLSLCIQAISQTEFYVVMSPGPSGLIKVSHINYIAIGR